MEEKLTNNIRVTMARTEQLIAEKNEKLKIEINTTIATSNQPINECLANMSELFKGMKEAQDKNNENVEYIMNQINSKQLFSPTPSLGSMEIMFDENNGGTCTPTRVGSPGNSLLLTQHSYNTRSKSTLNSQGGNLSTTTAGGNSM
jgi:hypothetical protein